MNSIPLVLLCWSTVAGLVLSIIITPHLIQSNGARAWKRALYCAILGPTVWTVILIAALMAAVMFLISCERLRRAKKQKQA